jgi:hypothetical protein
LLDPLLEPPLDDAPDVDDAPEALPDEGLEAAEPAKRSVEGDEQ